MCLMINIRSTDYEKKLKYGFDMYDKDKSGKLEKDEIREMLIKLTSHIADVRRGRSRSAGHGPRRWLAPTVQCASDRSSLGRVVCARRRRNRMLRLKV
jgi:hypothetical protein